MDFIGLNQFTNACVTAGYGSLETIQVSNCQIQFEYEQILFARVGPVMNSTSGRNLAASLLGFTGVSGISLAALMDFVACSALSTRLRWRLHGDARWKKGKKNAVGKSSRP